VFANVRYCIDRIEHFIAREASPVRQVILDARAISGIDVTAAEQLQTFIGRLRERGITFVVAKAHLPLREAAVRLGVKDALTEATYFAKLSDAVAAYERQAMTDG